MFGRLTLVSSSSYHNRSRLLNVKLISMMTDDVLLILSTYKLYIYVIFVYKDLYIVIKRYPDFIILLRMCSTRCFHSQ